MARILSPRCTRSSSLRIAANRANAQKSTGPKTPEGKAKSAANAVHSTGPRTPEGKARTSQNSLKHGLLANTIILPDECSEIFDAARAALIHDIQPRTYLESRCVDIMAVADWRRGRAWHLEQAQLTHAVHAQEALKDPVADRENTENPSMHSALAFGRLSNSTNTLRTLHRYEVRMSREFLRYLDVIESRRARHRTFSKRTKAKTR